MDENNNLENPNLNNGNTNNPNSNINEGNQDNSLQNNPYLQNTEDNPYYNPYFQNTTIDNSPYFDNSNVSINNDIYNQSYMDINNSQFNNQSDLPSLENKTDNQSTLSNDEIQTDNETNLSTLENQVQDSNEDLNLFDLNDDVNEQISNGETKNPDSNNNFNYENLNVENNTNFEPTSNVHINPILSQNINQSTNPNNDFMNESTNSYGSNNDEDFKRTWMGSLYDKANRRKFSIPSFFFGGVYYLYRKLYLFGFIFLIISCIIPIIGMNMILTNLTNPSTMILSSIFITILPIIINIIYGFAFYPLYKNNINQKLNKYKNEVQSPTQLIDLAKQKGGTSVLLVILGILLNGVISTIVLTAVLSSSINSIVNDLFKNNSMQNTLNNNINETENVQATYDLYNFYNNYSLEYDSSKWTENTDKKLVYDNYTISYIQSIENVTSTGFDINQSQGRSSFFTYLYNLFSSQLDLSTTSLELGSSSFIYENGIYYSYFDLVYATSIERCYFVLIPEDDIFIEFILSNNDTVITDAINEEVIGYICSITTNYQDNLDANNFSNTATDENGNSISNVVNNNDSEAQNNLSNTYSNSSSNISSSNNEMTITSNTYTNGISIMYNTMQ